MPVPIEAPADVRKVDGRWLRDCPKCGTVVSHLRRNYCCNASLIKQPCKACSNKNNHPAGFIGSVRVSWFNGFHRNALTRGYDWDISIEDVDALFQSQGGKCALSGLDIAFVDGPRVLTTASIDRIDNSIGYTMGNIQLVHKHINMMRGTLSVDDFVELAKAVAANATS
jgi:hypothetical protein